MKKLGFIFSVLVLTSCGYRTPIIDGKKPFVVEEIEKYDDTHSIYTSKDEGSGVWNDNTESNPRIALPSGMYNIGDTINVFKNK